jgi:hypothetical protein
MTGRGSSTGRVAGSLRVRENARMEDRNNGMNTRWSVGRPGAKW